MVVLSPYGPVIRSYGILGVELFNKIDDEWHLRDLVGVDRDAIVRCCLVQSDCLKVAVLTLG